MRYMPDRQSIPTLGRIVNALAQARPVSGSFKRPPAFLAQLPGGALYFDSTLELDTDGWPGHGAGDPTWQSQTSLRYINGASIDSNRVPYFVLPLPVDWPRQFGVRLGDYAAVIYKSRLAFATFADFGHNPGEGSIELLRRLGQERLQPDGSVRNVGMGPGVITIVFPGSGPGARMPNEMSLVQATQVVAAERFVSLGGIIGAPRPALPAELDDRIEIGLGLAAKIVLAAQQELRDYGNVTESESPLKERIGEYWKALGKDYDGSNDVPWSAAFVSYMVREAGGAATFLCSKLHSKYVHRAILDRYAQRQERFWAYRTGEIAIAPGDILAMNRGDSRPRDFEEAVKSDDYSSHADIAFEVTGGQVLTIGGNVGRSPGMVGTKRFKWKDGILRRVDNADQQVYAVLRPPAL